MGLDKTTERRLRVPAGIVQGAGSIPITVRDLGEWTRYFSKREQAFLEPFLLCPLFFKNRLSGIIIIASSPALDPVNPPPELESIMQEAGVFIYKAREESFGKLSGAETGPCRADTILEFCETVLKKNLHAILVSIDPMLYLDSLPSNLDKYRLFEDISRILSSLVSGNGLACKTDSGKILIVLESSYRMDSKLLHRHILSAVSTFLSRPPDSASLLCSVVICPDDARDPAEAVDKFLSG